MKRFWLYILIFAVLVALTLYLIFSKKPLSLSNELSLRDTAGVVAVTIADTQDTTMLEKQQGTWKSAEGYAIKADKVNLLLAVMHRMRVKSIIEEQNSRSIRESFGDSLSLRMRFDNSDERIWYVGDTLEAMQATEFMLPQNRTRIYLMHLPVYDVAVKEAIVSNPFYWRKKQIMAAKPDSICRIRLSYADTSKKGFELFRQGNTMHLKSLPKKNLENRAVQRYLSYFSNYVKYERNANPNAVSADTLLKQSPAITLVVETCNKKRTRLDIYRKPPEKPGQPFHPHKAYVVKNRRPQVWIARYYDIDLWLKEQDYFVKP